MTFGAFGAVFFEFRTINGLVPGTALLVVMVSLKFLEARSQRDHMLLTVIAMVVGSLLFPDREDAGAAAPPEGGV